MLGWLGAITDGRLAVDSFLMSVMHLCPHHRAGVTLEWSISRRQVFGLQYDAYDAYDASLGAAVCMRVPNPCVHMLAYHQSVRGGPCTALRTAFLPSSLASGSASVRDQWLRFCWGAAGSEAHPRLASCRHQGKSQGPTPSVLTLSLICAAADLLHQ
jgi:hypothetical protein